jgi:hypothetical protein
MTADCIPDVCRELQDLCGDSDAKLAVAYLCQTTNFSIERADSILIPFECDMYVNEKYKTSTWNGPTWTVESTELSVDKRPKYSLFCYNACL